MKSISTLALAASLVAGGFCLGTPALAQKTKASQEGKTRAKGKQPAQIIATTNQGRKLVLSKDAQVPLKALEVAIKVKDPTYPALLATAQAAVKTTDEKYALSLMRVAHAKGNGDQMGLLAAYEAVLASGGAIGAEVTGIHEDIATLASKMGNRDRAQQAFAKVAELSPNSSIALANLASITIEQNKKAEGLALLERAIAARKAEGGVVPESWLRNGLQLAHGERQSGKALQFSREALNAYPTAVNWRNALLLYREGTRANKDLKLDTLRLMRASKSIKDMREYLELAGQLNEGGLPGEAKAVLDEGSRTSVIPAGDSYHRAMLATVTPKITQDRGSLSALETKAKTAATGTLALNTADALLGYGDYLRAAALYRVALQKGSVNAGVANNRLGMALAMAGNKAEAEAAFRAVTGPHAELASFWLQWLSKGATLAP